jgi:SpoIIAA-like
MIVGGRSGVPFGRSGSMLDRITDLPENVVGIVASGTLTSEDYEEVLIPAVEHALEGHDKIRLLYVLGRDFEGLTAGATWDDTRVGFSHVTRWEKIAVVTDKDWVRHSVEVFGYLMPGEVKGFGLSEESAARSWVAA